MCDQQKGTPNFFKEKANYQRRNNSQTGWTRDREGGEGKDVRKEKITIAREMGCFEWFENERKKYM